MIDLMWRVRYSIRRILNVSEFYTLASWMCGRTRNYNKNTDGEKSRIGAN